MVVVAGPRLGNNGLWLISVLVVFGLVLAGDHLVLVVVILTLVGISLMGAPSAWGNKEVW